MLNISPHHPFLSCCRATEGLREGAREGGVERWEEESEGGLRTPPSKFKQTFEDNCRKAPEEIMACRLASTCALHKRSDWECLLTTLSVWEM